MRIVGPSIAVVLGAAVTAVPHGASATTSPTVVAVDGDDSAAGTLDAPLRTVQDGPGCERSGGARRVTRDPRGSSWRGEVGRTGTPAPTRTG
ncbi:MULTISPECIES: hypothetical protein [unclassified Streptomyces]|uniref:hypothetical protein n=1 Tax=unclassified Streptomyces TaxID=2593676 RepID=UPI000CD4C10A|nr:hypothetical protein [Streptomyces sp. SM10]